MNRSHKRLLLLFGFVSFVFYLGAAHLPFFGPDEPRYSQVARQMFESGDMVTPFLGPFPWFEKPVLLYWLMALSYRLFGVGEFAARVPSILATLGSMGVLYHTVRKASDPDKGLVAAGVFGTSIFILAFGQAATFDMLLTFFVTAGLCNFVLYELNHKQKNNLYLLYFCTGFGILAKGFAAIVLIGLPIFVYLLWFRKLSEIRRMHLPAGALIVIAVTALWFIPVTAVWGSRFWYEFFYRHHLLRYTTTTFHRSGGPLYYLPVLLLGTFPWTAFPFLRLRYPWKEQEKVLYRISACWFFTIVLFFSFSSSKLPGYILPAIPAFAAVSALSFVEYSRNIERRTRLAIAMSVTILLVAAGFCVALIFFPSNITRLTAGISESKRLSLAVKPKLTATRQLVVYNIYDFAPVFYTNARVDLTPEGYLYTLHDAAQLYRYLRRRKEAFVYVNNQELTWINHSGDWKVLETLPGQKRSMVLLTTK